MKGGNSSIISTGNRIVGFVLLYVFNGKFKETWENGFLTCTGCPSEDWFFYYIFIFYYLQIFTDFNAA